MKKILVGTPTYENLVISDYVHVLVQLQASNKVNLGIMTINSASSSRGKNRIFSFFVNYKQFDYLLFMDSDNVISSDDIIKLINYDLDIIAAPIRVKDINVMKLNFDNILDDSRYPLVEVDKVGVGLILIKLNVAEKLKDYCLENNLWYYNKDKNGQKEVVFNLFTNSIDDENNFLSEGYNFSRIARELGFRIYVDLSIKSVHYGRLPVVYTLTEYEQTD